MPVIHLGTPAATHRTKILLLGSGELGKEIAIEAQRLGVHVVACDRYPNAPAMQVAHDSHVFSMLDGHTLREVVQEERPDFIVPELEALAADVLVEFESEGVEVIPTARAARLTTDREGIRRLAAEELDLPTSAYRFAEDQTSFRQALEEIGTPCVVKPLMSSSGKGQTVVRTLEQAEAAWRTATTAGRGDCASVIVEQLIAFDREITLLTIRHESGTSFCEPIGHRQVDGDYRESWQPEPLSARAAEAAQDIAGKVTRALGGRGVFGVEMFVKGDEVIFSEVSARPHDTGLVTLISQDLSEFALHVRAILGLPIGNVARHGPSASCAILGEGEGRDLVYAVDPAPLREPDTDLRLFGKPELKGRRRLGVALARGASLDEAREKARRVAAGVQLEIR